MKTAWFITKNSVSTHTQTRLCRAALYLCRPMRSAEALDSTNDLVSTQEQCQLYREKDGHIWTPVFYSVNIAERADWMFCHFVLCQQYWPSFQTEEYVACMNRTPTSYFINCKERSYHVDSIYHSLLWYTCCVFLSFRDSQVWMQIQSTNQDIWA